jgi:hypothetical protein
MIITECWSAVRNSEASSSYPRFLRVAMVSSQYRHKGGIEMGLNFLSNFANRLLTQAAGLLAANFFTRGGTD